MKNPLSPVDKRGLVILLGVFALITLVSVILIILGVSLRGRNAALERAESLARERQAFSNSVNFGMEDFYRDSRDPDAGVIHPVRERQTEWSDEDIALYWIDPERAGIDRISRQSDRSVYSALGLLLPEDGAE